MTKQKRPNLPPPTQAFAELASSVRDDVTAPMRDQITASSRDQIATQPRDQIDTLSPDQITASSRDQVTAQPRDQMIARSRGDAKITRDDVTALSRDAGRLVKDIKASRAPIAKPRMRQDKPHTSVYLDPEVLGLIKIIAIKERKKAHDLYVEGVRLMLEARGYDMAKFKD